MSRNKFTIQSMNVQDKKFNVVFNPKLFVDLIYPKGFLANHPACHALYYYAQVSHENHIREAHYPILEGDKDPEYNYRQLFQSIAKMYGVEPEEMINFWSNVNLQLRFDREPVLPDSEKFRFDRPITIRSPRDRIN